MLFPQCGRPSDFDNLVCAPTDKSHLLINLPYKSKWSQNHFSSNPTNQDLAELSQRFGNIIYPGGLE